jgi:hypothetical protein
MIRSKTNTSLNNKQFAQQQTLCSTTNTSLNNKRFAQQQTLCSTNASLNN